MRKIQIPCEIRHCKDIGMFGLDRPKQSCKWRSQQCAACYNIKLYRAYKLEPKDARNERYWEQLTGSQLKDALATRRLPTNRFRFMTRGEAVTRGADIAKIKDLCLVNPKVTFWLPTRAWRNSSLWKLAVNQLQPLANLRMLASTDSYTSRLEYQALIKAGHSTMFFGDDDTVAVEHRYNIKLYRCPKTWNHKHGWCLKCGRGCFSAKQVHIHLKQH